MTVYGSSTFTAPNQSGWISSDGQTWTPVRGNQTLSIASNEGVMTYNGSTTAGIVQLGSTLVGDGEYLVRCTQGTNTTDEMGICVRFISTTNHYKFSQISGSFRFVRDVNGVFTNVATATFTSVVGTFYWIRARVVGTSFFGKIWQDGTAEPTSWQIGASGLTDTFLAGPAGYGLVGAPVASSNVKFDSFFAFDYINVESLSISDGFTGLVTAAPIEALSVSETLVTESQVQVVEALAITEAVTSTVASSPVESLVVQDQSWATVNASTVEALILSDSAGSTITIAPVEALAASDQWSAALAIAWAEALTISDSFTGISAVPQVIAVTWRTRDGTVAWLTRDGNITWRTRG